MVAPINGWIQALAHSINAPLTPEHVKFLNAWQRAEGGSTANNANYNPLNTTQGRQYPGINSVGVRSFPNLQTGIQQTAATLLNGNYGNIMNLLRNPNSKAAELAQAVASSPWGTGKGVMRTLGMKSTVQNQPMPRSGAAPKAKPVPDTNSLAHYLFSTLSNYGSTGNVRGNDTPNPLQNLVEASWGSGGKQPVPDFGKPNPPNPGGKANMGLGQSIAKTAYSQLGIPYQWGGQAKLGGKTDCSGLLQASLAAHGINIPRTTYDQWKVGQPVNPGNLQPGDAVFYKGSDSKNGLPGHVGIYIGGGKMIEDPHTGAVVSVSSYKRSDFMGARRYTGGPYVA